MLAGELYRPDAEIAADHAAAERWMTRYNASGASSAAELNALLSERFRKVGKDTIIRPPFFCDYGSNISLGDGVFLNFNCVILDVVAVTVGNGTQIGPGVQILTADHPRDPAHLTLRAAQPRQQRRLVVHIPVCHLAPPPTIYHTL